MAEQFSTFEELRTDLAAADFDRAPAFVCNAHYTGLGVARALNAAGVPVVAIDQTREGVASYSDTVDYAGRVTYPLDDQDGFAADLETLAAELDHEPVLFTCMDEWVHAAAATRPEGVRLSFSPDAIEPVLDKESLYAVAEDLGVPYPETYRLEETRTGTDPTPDGVAPIPVADGDEAAERLGFPLICKPARKREFEALVGTNVREVGDREELAEVVATAAEADVRLMAQERVDAVPGDDRSLASYVPPEGDPVAVVGNAVRRHPQPFGTSCVVERVDDPTIREHALSVLETAGYHGISEAEFVHDPERGEHVLLDVNTRPWKWIEMPVVAGANLPAAAYATATGGSYEPDDPRDVRWFALRDYLASLAEGAADRLSPDEWERLLAGTDETLVPAVYDPDDPGPAVRLLRTEFGADDYYCSC